MDKQSILAECRANPDKIFHLLRENDFERAKVLWGEKTFMINTFGYDGSKHLKIIDGKSLYELVKKGIYYKILKELDYFYHLKKLILAPDMLGYLEEHGKEGE